jgi:hypothetical protein
LEEAAVVFRHYRKQMQDQVALLFQMKMRTCAAKISSQSGRAFLFFLLVLVISEVSMLFLFKELSPIGYLSS